MGGKRAHTRGLPEVPMMLPPHVRQLVGADAGSLLRALQEPTPVSIRMNPAKPSVQAGAPVPWCAQGLYLDQRPIFTLDPFFHAGAYYVQEASSMLLEQAVAASGAWPDDPIALDLCAAPGGKSTHLASLIPRRALLIANEPVRSRQAVLQENLWKWGRGNVVVTAAEPDEFRPLGAFCDLILVDAPCSGEGMFRKDAHARAQWGQNLVEGCALRQRSILDAAWALLRPGGHLIYSTCTWETSENEDQVQYLTERGAVVVPVPVDPAWGVQVGDHGLRCYPHRVRGEGFFIAVVRKQAEPAGTVLPAWPGHDASHVESPVRDWLKYPEQQCILETGNGQHVLDKRWKALADRLSSTVGMLAPGVPAAVRKGHQWLPHPALALNDVLNADAFRVLDLDLMGIRQYLRGETLPAEEAEGPALVRHEGLPLGWVNGAGKRYNNRWHAPWRIRMR
jgi:16S rRNA C967 or C1407 C5-methylase (RsmB/RsmF family)